MIILLTLGVKMDEKTLFRLQEKFYYQWRMHKLREAIINGEYSFNLPQEVK